MTRIIEVTVTPKGDASIQTKGYAGADCLQASKFLEQALGVVANEVRTGEYFAATHSDQHVEQQ